MPPIPDTVGLRHMLHSPCATSIMHRVLNTGWLEVQRGILGGGSSTGSADHALLAQYWDHNTNLQSTTSGWDRSIHSTIVVLHLPPVDKHPGVPRRWVVVTGLRCRCYGRGWRGGFIAPAATSLWAVIVVELVDHVSSQKWATRKGVYYTVRIIGGGHGENDGTTSLHERVDRSGPTEDAYRA